MAALLNLLLWEPVVEEIRKVEGNKGNTLSIKKSEPNQCSYPGPLFAIFGGDLAESMSTSLRRRRHSSGRAHKQKTGDGGSKEHAGRWFDGGRAVVENKKQTYECSISGWKHYDNL